MISTASTTIMIVDLSVDPARQAEFDSFYHEFYLPAFLNAVPDIVAARRFGQTAALGKIDPAKAHFLTIYELASNYTIENVEASIAKSTNQEAAQFKTWKQEGLTHFDRAFYNEDSRNSRQPADGSWNNHSLYAFQWTVKQNLGSTVERWYVDEYIDLLMRKVPLWLACRTYSRVNQEQNSYLTIFEAKDQAWLLQAVAANNESMPDTDREALANWKQSALEQHTELSLEPICYVSK